MKNVPFYFDKQMLMKKLNLYSVKIDKVFTKVLFIYLSKNHTNRLGFTLLS